MTDETQLKAAQQQVNQLDGEKTELTRAVAQHQARLAIIDVQLTALAPLLVPAAPPAPAV